MPHPNRIPLSFSIELSPYLERLISDLTRDLGGITNLEKRDDQNVYLECIFPLPVITEIFRSRISQLSIHQEDP